MSFTEFHPNQPPPPGPPWWKGALLLPTLPFFLLVDLWPPLTRLLAGETTTHVESDGWSAAWKIARLAMCPYCNARVQHLHFDGRALPMPAAWRSSEIETTRTLATPIGVFMPWYGRWGRGHWEPPPYVLDGEFDAVDQQRGWYPTEYLDSEGRSPAPVVRSQATGWPVRRKAHTPPDWCLLEQPLPRWLDPRRLEEIVDQMERDPPVAPGLCTNCGYNLTGNTSGRCPECGQHL